MINIIFLYIFGSFVGGGGEVADTRMDGEEIFKIIVISGFNSICRRISHRFCVKEIQKENLEHRNWITFLLIL